MSMFFKGKKILVREDLKEPLAWAALILALAASFAAGYLLGRDDTPTPIIIEQTLRESGVE